MNDNKLLPDKSLLPKLDLNEELYGRNNVSIAFLVIISGLIKSVEQQVILEMIRPDYINVPFYRYLYEITSRFLESDVEIDIQQIIGCIPEFGPTFYGESSREGSICAHYFTLAQILEFQPTPVQISKAIDMVVAAAKKRNET